MKNILLLFLSLSFFSCVSAGDHSPVVNDISPDVNFEFPNSDTDSIIDENLNNELNNSLVSLLIRRF